MNLTVRKGGGGWAVILLGTRAYSFGLIANVKRIILLLS